MSILEVTDSILASLRHNAAQIAADGRDGRDILWTVSKPPPDTQRPYGWIRVVGEPRPALPGMEETQVQLDMWGPRWQIAEFADAIDWLRWCPIGDFGVLRGLYFQRESRNILEDPDLSGIAHLSDLYTARYLSVTRMEAAMS